MKNNFLKIILCLTVTCFSAAILLGVVFYFTEPLKQINRTHRENKLIQKLFHLNGGATIIEIRRYLISLSDGIGYLLPDALLQYDIQGNLVKKILRPDSMKSTSSEASDHWVQTIFPKSRFSGRFFVAFNQHGKKIGYVTESSRYGFKSPIRFFVALSPDFQILAVEVVFHEEDPGLGAEIAKPFFKNQFQGLLLEELPQLKLIKGPPPPQKQNQEKEKIIYGVTGATISSKALVDGVKQAVSNLNYRIQILSQTGDFNHE